jgi:hypothetical protein
VADGFDVVAVGIEDERAVVVRPIVRPWTGRAEVAPAVRERGRMEG